MSRLANVRGALIDVDGVLHVDGEPIPGAADALDHLRQSKFPFVLLTNTTMHTRAALGELLRGRGFDVVDGEIITAAAATADYLRRHHPGETCYLIVSGDVAAEFSDIPQKDGLDADLASCQHACDQWRVHYNTQRPHEALDLAVPAEHYQPSPRTMPASLPEVEYSPTDLVRKVKADGYFAYLGGHYRLGRGWKGLSVALRPTSNPQVVAIYYGRSLLKELDLLHDRRV